MTAPFPGQIARFLHKRYYANDVVLKGRPAALSFGANPRHAHEWKVWKDVRPQEGKVIIPSPQRATYRSEATDWYVCGVR